MDSNESLIQRILSVAQTDMVTSISILIAFIGFAIYEPYGALCTFIGIVLMGFGFQIYQWVSRRNTAPSKKVANIAHTTEKKPKDMQSSLKSVWEVGKNLGRGAASQRGKTSHGEKPFGSSYYYAHNNPNAAGGYKDGLRMEDYRMNGPRLLSRGGQPVQEESDQATVHITSTDNREAPPSESENLKEQDSKTEISQVSEGPSLPTINITKYLWDDPGDFDGIATIRVDKLPKPKSKHETIDWKDASVEEVSAALIDEGLIVRITTGVALYRLQIKKLYGDASSVETLVKAKRLLIKIHKTQHFSLMKNSNLEAWPQPHKKL